MSEFEECLQEIPAMISAFQEELDQKELIMNQADPNSEEFEKARLQRDILDQAVQALWRVDSPEEAEKYFGPLPNREKFSPSYAEKTNRKEEICVSDNDVIEQLKRSIVECDTFMTQFPYGSEEYREAADLKQAYIRHYLEALRISNERRADVWEKVKWAINIGKDLAVALIPVAVYVVLFHQSLNFESEGSYRARTTSNLVSKMAPKGLQG